MDYELCKELEEAGFPQKGSGFIKLKNAESFGDFVYFPTLSELIAACGHRFESLTQMRHVDENNYWIAEALACEQCGWENYYVTRGITPEEAVAKLWLELNRP